MNAIRMNKFNKIKGDNKDMEMMNEDMIIKPEVCELNTANVKEKSNSITVQINFVNMVIISICMLFIGFGLGYLVSTFNNYNDLVKIDDSYKQSINSLEETIYSKESSIDNLNYNIDQLASTIDVLEDEKVQIAEKLSVFEQREELYNKYEYIIEVGNKRTDITYEQLAHGEELMKDRGLNPHLLFGVVYLESRGNEKATNSRSTARGYCQFLGSTAKSVYERMLNKGTYNHDLAFDGYINLELGAEYLSYLMKTQNGSIMTSLLLYNGAELGERYYHIIDNMLVKYNKPSLAQIEREYKNNRV